MWQRASPIQMQGLGGPSIDQYVSPPLFALFTFKLDLL
jgi:hypothetical protein